MPLAEARRANVRTSSSTQSSNWNSLSCSSSRPDSIREKSSTSLMTTSRLSAELRAIARHSVWVGSRGVCMTRSSIPMTPFIGVLISWLICARNWLLARLASSAASFSVAACSSWRRMTFRLLLNPKAQNGDPGEHRQCDQQHQTQHHESVRRGPPRWRVRTATSRAERARMRNDAGCVAPSRSRVAREST